MAGFEPLSDELANPVMADLFCFDFLPDFDRSVGGVAGPKGRIELLQRRPRVVDKLYLHRRLRVFHTFLYR